MCQREVAIVSDIAGTTRDVIESTHNFGGYPVRFVDTAGLRTSAEDIIEKQGILKTKQSIGEADLVLLIADSTHIKNLKSIDSYSVERYFKDYLKELDLDEEMLKNKQIQPIINKTDLLSQEENEAIQRLPKIIGMSCKQTEDMKCFLGQFEAILKEL